MIVEFLLSPQKDPRLMKRLTLLLAGLLLVTFSAESRAADPPSSGRAMTEAAQQFLAALTPAQKKQVVMDFDNPARRDWHNIPKPTRKGMQLREMSPELRVLCHNLLKAGLSETGYKKAVRIMSLENNLHVGEQGKGVKHLRDPERYFLTIFGTPAHDSTWGWSFEGHHLSLNFTIQNDEVISHTPSFWGANPATVHVFVDGGPEVGVRTLAAEEQLAFDLVKLLTPEQQKKAIIAEKAPADYRNAGKPLPPNSPGEGISGAELNQEQQAILWKLLKAYNGHIADDIATARFKELRIDGLDQVYFAWLGSTTPGVGHAYRIQGPTFVLELVNVQSDPEGNKANHIHSVWRSLKTDFGGPAE